MVVVGVLSATASMIEKWWRWREAVVAPESVDAMTIDDAAVAASEGERSNMMIAANQGQFDET